jgi:hypothetical protein
VGTPEGYRLAGQSTSQQLFGLVAQLAHVGPSGKSWQMRSSHRLGPAALAERRALAKTCWRWTQSFPRARVRPLAQYSQAKSPLGVVQVVVPRADRVTA